MILPELISKGRWGRSCAAAGRSSGTAWRALVAVRHARSRGARHHQGQCRRAVQVDRPLVQRLLGVTLGNGKALQLDEKWAYNIVKQVGNYGESYERNVGMGSPLKLARGLQRPVDQGRPDVSHPARAEAHGRRSDNRQEARGPLNASIVETFDSCRRTADGRALHARPARRRGACCRCASRRGARACRRPPGRGWPSAWASTATTRCASSMPARCAPAPWASPARPGVAGRGAEPARRARAGRRDGDRRCRASSRLRRTRNALDRLADAAGRLHAARARLLPRPALLPRCGLALPLHAVAAGR